MPGGHGFGGGGHAHRVGAEDFQRPDLRRGLELWPRHLGVHPLVQRDSRLFRRPEERRQQPGRIEPGHVREPGPEALQIFAPERGGEEELEMIRHRHEASGDQPRRDAARGVGEEQFLHPEHLQEPQGHDRLVGGTALVVVEPSGEDHGVPPQRAPGEGSFVEGRPGKIGELAVGDRHLVFEGVGDVSPARAGNDPDRHRRELYLFPQKIEGLLQPLFHNIHDPHQFQVFSFIM